MAIAISGRGMTLDDVVAIGRGSRASLNSAARGRVSRSRRVVDALLRDKKAPPAYGVTTGFGPLASTRISHHDVEALQRNLVLSTACGVGEPFPREVVRAMMALRANALAKGLSGIRLETLELLLAMLDRGVHPLVPSRGSVGASGDLAPLAHLALGMIGEGQAEFEGRTTSARDALRRARLAPATLQAKEGLSLINGTQAMTALACFAVHDGSLLLKNAQIAAAMSLEALMGSVAPLDPRLHEARPFPGQKAVASNLRKLLAGSGVVASHADCERVQDPYTLRCIPQVLGATHDALAHATRMLEIEINSANDNPLVLDGDVVSGGNFHGQPVALLLAYLAPALAEVGSFAERRVARLVDGKLNEGLPPFLTEASGLNSGYMIPQYVAAALVSENRMLSWPAVVDNVPTSANQEDHVSMGVHAGLAARRIVENAERVVGIELLLATQALDFRAPHTPAPGTAAARDEVRKTVPHLGGDRWLKPEIDQAAELVRSGAVLKAVEKRVGKLG